MLFLTLFFCISLLNLLGFQQISRASRNYIWIGVGRVGGAVDTAGGLERSARCTEVEQSFMVVPERGAAQNRMKRIGDMI